MRRADGVLQLWADIKADRLSRGEPVVGGHLRAAGQFAPVPLAEAAAASGGDLQEAEGSVALQEAAVPSDFPAALGNTLWREMIRSYGTVDEPWRNYYRIGENNDFRVKNEILASEFEDLLPVPVGDEYKDSLMTDAFFQVTLAVYGRLFTVNRETIINDDIGLLRDTPGRMGRAVARTLNKYAVRTTLEGNPLCYDGTALFTGGHGNLVSGAGSALSNTSLQTGLYTMQTNVGDAALNPSGGPMGIEPKLLVVPPALKFTARNLVQSSLVVAAAGTVAATPATLYGNINVLQNIVDVVVDPWLTSTTAWYLFADPAQVPGLVLNFLRGRPNPDLLMERPYMSDVMGGGEDPYEVEIDKLAYKTRHQWGAAGGVFWGVYKSAGA